MTRRRFISFAALGALLAAFPSWAQAWVLPAYPPFARAGALITPSWRWIPRGEKIYVLGAWIRDDGYRLALIGHWHLATSMDNTTTPDFGKSPKELGFLGTPWAKVQFAESTWKTVQA